MPSIDPELLNKAMSQSGVSSTRLADELDISLQYVCDITAGRRRLSRKPDLRKRIAEVLDVPQHWIEAKDDETTEEVASS